MIFGCIELDTYFHCAQPIAEQMAKQGPSSWFAVNSLSYPLRLCRLAFGVGECVRLVFVNNLVKSGNCAGGEVVPLRPLQPPN
jgi:hypothetical protein